MHEQYRNPEKVGGSASQAGIGNVWHELGSTVTTTAGFQTRQARERFPTQDRRGCETGRIRTQTVPQLQIEEGKNSGNTTASPGSQCATWLLCVENRCIHLFKKNRERFFFMYITLLYSG